MYNGYKGACFIHKGVGKSVKYGNKVHKVYII